MDIQKEIARYVLESPDNVLTPEDAITPDLAGIAFFGEPLVGVARADDPLFETLRRPGAVGPWFRLPGEWLPGAKSVVSVFFPYTDEVKNREDPAKPEPAPVWLNARIEGERFVTRAAFFLRDRLQAEGFEAVIPTAVPGEFWSVWAPGTNPEKMPDPSVGFTSPWSERHVAFVCGLGTFGLSAGLITAKGVCGRFRSIVTTAPLPPTERPYHDVYEYCTHCNQCARNCPVGAIDPVTGKCHDRCGQRLNESKALYAPRYGCGKCQIGVPCMSRIPKR